MRFKIFIGRREQKRQQELGVQLLQPGGGSPMLPNIEGAAFGIASSLKM